MLTADNGPMNTQSDMFHVFSAWSVPSLYNESLFVGRSRLMDKGDISSGLKRWRSEANHPISCRTEVMNGGTTRPLPHRCST
jgi:hypothetical protein